MLPVVRVCLHLYWLSLAVALVCLFFVSDSYHSWTIADSAVCQINCNLFTLRIPDILALS